MKIKWSFIARWGSFAVSFETWLITMLLLGTGTEFWLAIGCMAVSVLTGLAALVLVPPMTFDSDREYGDYLDSF